MPLYTCQPLSFRGRGMCICCTRQSRILLPYISSSCFWYLFWARPLVWTFLWGFPCPHSLAQQPDHHPQSRSEETLWRRSRRRGKKRAEEGGGSLSSSSRIDCTWTRKTRLSQRNSTSTKNYLYSLVPWSSTVALKGLGLYYVQCTMWLSFSKNGIREISTTAPIFSGYNYFRQYIWDEYLVQFHFQYIFGPRWL